MTHEIGRALRMTAITLLVTGVIYPVAITGMAQLLFPGRASGSWVTDERGRIVGSELIAQAFVGSGYFQPRPSAAGDKGFDATSSSGSNLGPTSKKLKERIAQELNRLRAENPDAPSEVPAELVTASASGLDPHLSPEAVLWQVPRVARARGISAERIKTVVLSHLEGRDLRFLGEPRLNVLSLNLALDRQFGRPVTRTSEK
jgi:K+-transporting ATPase ATPase C chain